MGFKLKIKMVVSWAKTAILFLSLLIMECRGGIITGNLQMTAYNITPATGSFNLPIYMDLYITKKSGEWANINNITWNKVYLGYYNPQGSKFVMSTNEVGCFYFNIDGDSGEMLVNDVYYRFISCEGVYQSKCCSDVCDCGCECQCDTSCCSKTTSGLATMQISMQRFANNGASDIIFNLTTENYLSTVPEPTGYIFITASLILFYRKRIADVLFLRRRKNY
jgi:hypothetical protein